MATDKGPRSTETGQLSEAARGVAEQAEQTVEAKASTTMNQLSGTIEGVAHAIRRAGDDLRGEQPQLASVADTAADQVDRLSRYLHESEPREVLDQLEDAARRQPALVIAGGLAVGLILGRLLRTAAPSIQQATASTNGGDGRRGSGYRYQARSMYAAGTAGDWGGGTRDVGDPAASFVSGTRVVDRGDEVETGGSASTRTSR
jgi:ElaB/YqjD/DUF883 family membrane-anchored ribosome-binding protein